MPIPASALCSPSYPSSTTDTSRTAQHRDYWANNGGSPNPDSYFPGFEAGWNDTKEKLSNGEEFPGDLKAHANDRANQTGQPEGSWEWEHGFIAGAEACRQAGEA
jgi:hypothetical protein